MYEQLIAALRILCVSNLRLFEEQLLWHLRKMPNFVTIRENFSLFCFVLCRVTELANFFLVCSTTIGDVCNLL